MNVDLERATRLKQAMHVRRFSIRKLASVIDKRPATIDGWRKTGQIGCSAIIPTCKALNISLYWLLAGQGHVDQPFTPIDVHLGQKEHGLIDLLRSHTQPIRYALRHTLKTIEQVL